MFLMVTIMQQAVLGVTARYEVVLQVKPMGLVRLAVELVKELF